MAETKIAWATHTENWMAGCAKVSAACADCYAIRQSAYLASLSKAPDRYRGITVGGQWTGEVRVDLARMHTLFDALDAARKPRRVFCNSMSDTFHAAVPQDALDELGDRLYRLPERHVAMLLTKRTPIMVAWSRRQADRKGSPLPRNVYLGVTVEDQASADARVPLLLDAEAGAVGGLLYLSMEPLLEAVTLQRLVYKGVVAVDALRGLAGWPLPHAERSIGGVPYRRVEWVIAGGESGPRARPMHPAWARSLRDECASAGTPFLLKQWGEWAPGEEVERNGTAWTGMYEDDPRDGGAPQHHWPDSAYRRPGLRGGADGAAGRVGGDTAVLRVGKRAAGRLLDGVLHDGAPE